MKIKGLKYLNANNYNKIIIHDLNVTVYGNDINYPTIKSEETISDELKKLADEEKIQIIIDYYLSYNKLYSIEEKDYLLVKSSSGKELKIYNCDENTKNIILDKYLRDRIEFLYNFEITNYNIELSNKETKYKYMGNNRVNLTLMSNGLNLVNYEEKFIKNLIEDLFKEEIIRVECEEIDGVPNLEYYLVGNNMRIKLPYEFELTSITRNLVNKHNNELKNKNEQVYQMKLEEF